MSRPLVIAHRGASVARPENTLAAFELAVVQDADMIETDLHRTRDGEVVIAHDAGLAGLGGKGSIGQASAEEIRTLDAGAGERVPTLAETLDAFGARIPFNLELKLDERRRPYPGLEATVLDAVETRGLLARTLFSCFDDRVLERLRALSPGARIGLLLSPRHPGRALERAGALAAEALHPHHALVTAELVEAAHAAGLAVYAFTVDAADEMRRLLDLGADGLFTNHPDRLRALLG